MSLKTFVTIWMLVIALLAVGIICVYWGVAKSAETGFVFRWSIPDGENVDRFIVSRTVHPDSAWSVIAESPADVFEIWDFSVESGLRYFYHVQSARIDTIETDTGITFVERISPPSNIAAAMEIRFADAVETFENRVVEYYTGTDSLVMLVVYPDTTCADIDVFTWEFMLFMDRVRLQCQADDPPPPVEAIEPIE